MPEDNNKRTDVAVAVISDIRGRVLLNRRPRGRDQAGLWEFPGGKQEPGETIKQALVRELQEELGIDAVVGEHLITIPQRYAGKNLCLHVYCIDQWTGQARGREGQSTVWVAKNKLRNYSMLPADGPIVSALLQAPYYLITPSVADNATEKECKLWLADLYQAAQAYQCIQLRLSKTMPQQKRRALLLRALDVCKQQQCEVLVNQDIEFALEHAVGVHLTSEQVCNLRHRPIDDVNLPVAASCHDVEQLQAAQEIGCNFVVMGPVKTTPTHPTAIAMGWEQFGNLRQYTSLPVYALGGLRAHDFLSARESGAQGIAGITGLWPDVSR